MTKYTQNFDPRFKNLLLEAIDAHEKGKLHRADECLAEARVLLEMDLRFGQVA